jgi:hypothetical protein
MLLFAMSCLPITLQGLCSSPWSLPFAAGAQKPARMATCRDGYQQRLMRSSMLHASLTAALLTTTACTLLASSISTKPLPVQQRHLPETRCLPYHARPPSTRWLQVRPLASAAFLHSIPHQPACQLHHWSAHASYMPI